MSELQGKNIIQQGLVLHLDSGNPQSFDGNSTIWRDLSENGNNGTLVNGVSYSGNNRGVLSFDGTNDYVDCGVSVCNFNLSNFSISFWFKTTIGGGSNSSFMAKSIGNNPTVEYGWLLNSPGGSNEIGFACASSAVSWGSNGSYSVKTVGANVNSGAWKMVTLTARRSDLDVNIYINGLNVNITDYVGGKGKFNFIGQLSNNYPFRIGSESDNLYINSSMNCIQVYNRSLSQEEITQNYNATKDRFNTIVYNGLVLNLDASNSLSYDGTTTWRDLSGNNNHGTLVNGVGYTSSNSGSLVFDGTNDYAYVTKIVQDDFSLCCWFKTTMTGGTVGQWYSGIGIMDNENPGGQYDFGVSMGSGRIMWGTGNPDTTITTPTSYNDGIWHNIIATRSKTLGVKNLYIDGIFITSGTTNTVSLNAGGNIKIGVLQTLVNGYFNGQISMVHIYNRALTQDEITQNYNATKSKFGL